MDEARWQANFVHCLSCGLPLYLTNEVSSVCPNGIWRHFYEAGHHKDPGNPNFAELVDSMDEIDALLEGTLDENL